MLTHSEIALRIVESASLTQETTRRDFFAMGTSFYFVGVECPDEVLNHLEARALELESKWTRFSSSSELMSLNLANGQKRSISSDLALLIGEMIEGYEITNGRFNPSILPTMVRQGFVTDSASDDEAVIQSETHIGNMLEIELDRSNLSVLLPQGMMLDAGGIGKGLAADLLADLAMDMGAKGIAVFAGGEVSVRGMAPAGNSGWTIGIQNPWDDKDLLDIVELSRGGMATSSVEARTVNNAHHLIDPTTGSSFNTDIVQATVLCDRATDAEILTKACFAYKRSEALAMVEDAGAQALIVISDGSIYRSQGWEDFT